MRSLAVGALLLLVSTLAAAPTEAVLIENPPFVLAPVPWEFSTATNTFSGEQGGFVLHVLFDDLGNFQSGTFEQRGSPGNQLLMKGTVVGVPTPVDISGEFFFVPFALDITFSSPQLPIHVDAAIWDAYICHGGKDCGPNGPTSVEEVFTTDYSDAWVPVHNTLHTFRVPYPSAGALLWLGLLILVAIRAGATSLRKAILIVVLILVAQVGTAHAQDRQQVLSTEEWAGLMNSNAKVGLAYLSGVIDTLGAVGGFTCKTPVVLIQAAARIQVELSDRPDKVQRWFVAALMSDLTRNHHCRFVDTERLRYSNEKMAQWENER
jgi:hypothetical protein